MALHHAVATTLTRMPFTFNFEPADSGPSTAGESGFAFNFGDESDHTTQPHKRAKSSNADPKRLEERDKAAAVPAVEVTFNADEIRAESSEEVLEARKEKWAALKLKRGEAQMALLRGQEIQGAEEGDLGSVVADTDLAPKVYEGGLKLWECAVDLCHHMTSHYNALEPEAFKGYRVLELGCGHGLPGILALKGGAVVDFADFNHAVICKLTFPNVCTNQHDALPRARFFSGGWDSLSDVLGPPKVVLYDLILTSDTLYAPESMEELLDVMAKRLKPDGVALIAAKTYYFGVGGGTDMFTALVKKDGRCKIEVAEKYADGSTNVREMLKLTLLPPAGSAA